MAYLIDTDRLIDWLEDQPYALDLFETLYDEGLAISIVTYLEAYEGVLREERDSATGRRLRHRIAEFRIVELSPSVARRCAAMRLALRRAGKRPDRRSMDLIIAATAIEHDLTLVTRNTGDYSDIPGIALHTP